MSSHPGSPFHVPVVDADVEARLGIVRALEAAGMRCVEAPNAAAVSALLESSAGPLIDLIVLSATRSEREDWSALSRRLPDRMHVPVLLLTESGAPGSQLREMNRDAADCVPTSAELTELVARVQAAAQRARATKPIVHGDLEIDVVNRRVGRRGRTFDLSPREFDLLRAMASQPDRTWTRAELLAEVWGIHSEPESNLVNAHLARLRAKLAEV